MQHGFELPVATQSWLMVAESQSIARHSTISGATQTWHGVTFVYLSWTMPATERCHWNRSYFFTVKIMFYCIDNKLHLIN